MQYELYLITNLIDSKRYVGQCKESVGYLKRFQAHVYDALSPKGHKNLLHAAMKCYGVENFKVVRILKHISESSIDFYEQLWIYKLHTFYMEGKGYNMTSGGQGIHCYTHTSETKHIISKKALESWKLLKEDSEKYSQRSKKLSIKLKGRVYSENTLSKMSESAKSRFKNKPGTFTGRAHTEASKQLISEKNGAAVEMLDPKTGEVLKWFCSAVKATEYLIQENLTSNKYANARILMVCKGSGKLAYGFKWRYKCND